MVRVTTDYETIRPVSRFIEGMLTAQQHGVVTAEESEQWIAAFEETIRTDRFFYAITWS